MKCLSIEEILSLTRGTIGPTIFDMVSSCLKLTCFATGNIIHS